MLVHNHPSGHPEPSRANIEITQRLQSALALVDIRTLDHLVVASNGVVSLKERGYMNS
ncbi:JAB domain-containing protein [Aeromonas salmonicida]|uniref:JAB domain-containing protein n=1 Tax=Aeromonas salmonicida TaxID=645 RepID=UPI003D0074A8